MAPKVLVADKLSRLALDIFAKRGIDAHVKADLPRDELQWSHGDGLVLRGLAELPVRLFPNHNQPSPGQP